MRRNKASQVKGRVVQWSEMRFGGVRRGRRLGRARGACSGHGATEPDRAVLREVRASCSGRLPCLLGGVDPGSGGQPAGESPLECPRGRTEASGLRASASEVKQTSLEKRGAAPEIPGLAAQLCNKDTRGP